VDWEAEQITYDYYHGYTKLEKEGIEPCIPYGFGLSYTTFEVSKPSVKVNGDFICASCLVKNTGSVEGDQVVQLYTGFGNSGVDRPIKLLRGFRRISLKPGEAKEITISCPIEKLKWYNPGKECWELEHLTYTAYIGTSSDNKDLMEISFTL
jgi:beta-glucosidase